MRRHVSAGMAGVAAVVLVTGLGLVPADAAVTPSRGGDPTAVNREDNLPHPLGEKRNAIRKEAISKLLTGAVQPQMRNGSKVVRLAGNRYAEIQQPTKVDPIFTILVEFGTQTLPETAGTPGPLHNQIPAPDRVYDGGATDDNTTIWRSDFSRAYFNELLYAPNKESMRDFYLKQSGGRYTVGGDVSDWVKAPFNEARYGSNKLPDSAVYWPFVKDTAKAWYDQQVASGKTNAQITAYLKQFDVWDRYDYDLDGNFNEADGYIDHFQAVHAGEGEEAGGGAQGEDAIWSHRWYAFANNVGSDGPAFNKAGGVPLGNTGLWIGDYTTEPENGGLGVFAHEYGHDLGLPDLYDTAGGDNGSAFWTLMSGGSWMNHGPHDIGSTPDYMGPWEKLFLGWLNYRTVNVGGKAEHVVLGAAGDTDGPFAQAVVVNLPPQTINTKWNDPFAGQWEWWTGSADNQNVTLTRDLDLTAATSASITAKTQYAIEEDFDFLYGEVSTNGGSTWTKIPTAGIDPGESGLDGTTNGAWVDLNYDLTAYVNQTVKFRYRYQTDGGVHEAGVFLDNLSLIKNGTTVFTDTVEEGPGAWVAAGWQRFTGTETKQVPHYYIAENRSYFGYDDTLRTGPYNFGWGNTRPNFVERFPYREGMLVWYVNMAYDDNNTSAHPGFAQALPIDVRPAPIVGPAGNISNRRNGFDSAFSRLPTPALTLHQNGVPVNIPAKAGTSVFDDSVTDRYWSAANPQNSVKVPGTGTRIEIRFELHGANDMMLIRVTPPRA